MAGQVGKKRKTFVDVEEEYHEIKRWMDLGLRGLGAKVTDAALERMADQDAYTMRVVVRIPCFNRAGDD